MIDAFFSTLPFTVCLLWAIIFLLRWNDRNDAQRLLFVFSCVCTLLYGCHALYFLGEQTLISEVIWRGSSLSVYPLYYIYVVRLTTREISIPWYNWLLLTPALLVMSLRLVWPSPMIPYIQAAFFALLLCFCVASGLWRLWHLEKEITNYYADTDDKSGSAITKLLIYLSIASVCSTACNALGRDFFYGETVLIIPSIVFSTALFSIFYIGDRYTFSALQITHEESIVSCELKKIAASQLTVTEEDQAMFIARLNKLMKEEHIFLESNLKIRDVALRAGTCRTYLSNYINQELHTTFSDYINSHRITYAQQLLEKTPTITLSQLASESGFASEQSFLRNYRKFTGQNAPQL